MPVRSSQPSSYPGGRARIDVIGTGSRVADPVRICIVDQMAGADKSKHLDPRTPEMPWKPAIFWFAPTNVQREGAQLSFDLEHGITFHLRPNAPYILRLAGVDDEVVEERLVWKPVRGKSSAPEWTAPPEASWPPDPPPVNPPPTEPPLPEPAPVPSPPAEPVAPPAIDTVTVQQEDGDHREKRFPVWGLAVAAAIVLAIGGGAAWWFLPAGGNVAQVTPAPPPSGPATVQEARRMVQEKIPADGAVREAQRFLDAKSLDGAFLLFRHAAEQGNAGAAVAVGGMYDPVTHSPETSPLPAPNADQAASWYAKAADAGDAEGEFRLGRVLMSGKTEDPQGPEKAIMWLQKAADQGHDGARAALPK
jgi:hypothetical protein